MNTEKKIFRGDYFLNRCVVNQEVSQSLAYSYLNGGVTVETERYICFVRNGAYDVTEK